MRSLGALPEVLSLAAHQVALPNKRITIAGIKQHPFFTRNLPKELQVTVQRLRFAFGQMSALHVNCRLLFIPELFLQQDIIADSGRGTLENAMPRAPQQTLTDLEAVLVQAKLPPKQLQPLHIPKSRAA